MPGYNYIATEIAGKLLTRILAGGVVLDELVKQFPGGFGDLGNSGVECGLVCTRWLPASAHFAHELQRRGGDFLSSGNLLMISKYFDATAHEGILP
jgi:hypothetical protein